MADFVNRVTTLYRADVSQAKVNVQSLRGVERDRARAVLDDLNKHNAGLQSQIATIGKVTAVVGGLAGAYVVAQKAAKAYLEDVRLESAAAGADLARLQEATLGLVEADNLLAFAGKSMNGAWKLNQGEMETVLKGATALRKTMGVELQPTIEKLTKAISKGMTEELKEFGIVAKDKAGVIQQLDGLFQGLGGNAGLAGDSMQASGVKLADTFDDLQGNLGELVIKLEPVIAAFADLIGQIPQIIDWFDELSDSIVGVDGRGGTAAQQRGRQVAGLRMEAWEIRNGMLGQFREAEAGDLERQADQLERFTKSQQVLDANKAFGELAATALGQAAALEKQGVDAGVRKANLAFDELAKAALKGAAKMSGRRGRDTAGPSLDFEGLAAFGGSLSGIPGGLVGAAEGAWSGFQTSQALAPLNMTKQGAEMRAEIEKTSALVLQAVAELDAAIGDQDQKNSVLSKIFGTPSEIDELATSIKLASSAFDVMTAGATAAFDAWITGSKSIGMALTEAIADGLRASASQMLVESIKHTAFGIGALAFGGPLAGASAGAHFKAAAAFAGGAVLAGASAKALGGATGQWSGGGGGAGSGRAPDVSRGGRPEREQGGPVNVYIGSEWAGMSGIEQSQTIQRAVRKGRTTSHIRRG